MGLTGREGGAGHGEHGGQAEPGEELLHGWFPLWFGAPGERRRVGFALSTKQPDGLDGRALRHLARPRLARATIPRQTPLRPPAGESTPNRGAGAAYAARVLRLYDTASGEVRELAQRQPGQVDIYLCGPTVYGPPHLGHGRATLAYDVLRRYLEWSGLRVRLVSNITDIDDKIIARANREGRDADEIARRCEAVWFQAMQGIGVDPPTDIPHATDYVEQMVAMIGQLIEIGRAYPTEDGVYLDVTSVEDYGLLAHQSLDQMLVGGGEREVYGQEQKHHPADFALWKAAKPDEPSWPSPWGDGRPGWHTECVVMSLDLLGDGFDLHCGGLDLKFPHHENERAQAVALGHRFANHWMHHAFVVDEAGEKMSKSVGNIENLLDLIEKVDGRAFRMVLLQAHYRSPVQVGRDRLEAAERARRPRRCPRPPHERPARRRARRGHALRLRGPHGRRPRHAGRHGRRLRHHLRRQQPARRR